jgi:hypothetical protein
MMDKPAIGELVAMMSLRIGDQPPAYYEILARVAAQSTGKLVPPGEKAPPEVKEAVPARQRPGHQPRSASQRSGRTARATPVSAEAEAAAAAAQAKAAREARKQDMEFRWRCMVLLGRGPAASVASVLQDERIGLLADEFFGPETALMLKERVPSFDVAAYLSEQFAKRTSAAGRCEVIAVEQKLASGDLSMMQVLLGYLTAGQTGGGNGAGGTLGDTVWTGDPMRCAARALGSLGYSDALMGAFEFRQTNDTRVFRYPPEVRKAALEGLTLLPPRADPVGTLRRCNQLYLDNEMKGLGEEATLEAYRLRADSTKVLAEGKRE